MTIPNNDEYVNADVLVLGGGLAGCLAAIKAAENGAEVVLFEKAEISRSGNGSTGLHRIPLIHPDYNYSHSQFAKLNVEAAAGICDEDVSYEFAKDTLDRVLDIESYGIKVRKNDGSFMFKPAPDISPGNVVIWGPGSTVWHDVKPKLAERVKKSRGTRVFNRVATIGLLTRSGEIGAPVIGAVGLGTRTGQFIICTAKAVVLANGGSYRVGRHKDSMYAPTRFIECGCPTNSGDGQFMAYRAGADLINLEFLELSPSWKDLALWGVGPISAVGRQVLGSGEPGTVHGTEMSKFLRYKNTCAYGFDTEGLFYDASFVPGYPEEKGEMLELLWAEENESTSPGYLLWQKERGEDFRKAPIEFEWHPPYIHNNQAGVHMDLNAGSTLEGLYCAGDVIGGGWRQSSGGALVFGARAGRNAAEYAKATPEPEINKDQVKAEKERILKATEVNPREGYSWIELEDKARKIVSEYGPPFTSDAKLQRGLFHLDRIKARYLPKLFARNPREMLRVSEVQSVFFVAQAHLKCALFRKESRSSLVSILYKRGYPKQDDKDWLKHTVVRNVAGEMTLGTKEVKRL
jgi:succinate dehydrogenase/fumarate reductase flavoprotein subunit